MSSAYCIIGNSLLGWGIGIDNRPMLEALLTIACSKSAARTKRRGEKGVTLSHTSLTLEFFPRDAIEEYFRGTRTEDGSNPL